MHYSITHIGMARRRRSESHGRAKNKRRRRVKKSERPSFREGCVRVSPRLRELRRRELEEAEAIAADVALHAAQMQTRAATRAAREASGSHR